MVILIVINHIYTHLCAAGRPPPPGTRSTVCVQSAESVGRPGRQHCSECDIECQAYLVHGGVGVCAGSDGGHFVSMVESPERAYGGGAASQESPPGPHGDQHWGAHWGQNGRPHQAACSPLPGTGQCTHGEHAHLACDWTERLQHTHCPHQSRTSVRDPRPLLSLVLDVHS